MKQSYAITEMLLDKLLRAISMLIGGKEGAKQWDAELIRHKGLSDEEKDEEFRLVLKTLQTDLENNRRLKRVKK